MGSSVRTGFGFSWWVAWVLWCAPAGALAAWGLVEFYAEYPNGGYDGGFAGDLIFFGAFLALGQAPLIAVFVWSLLEDAGARPWRKCLAAAGVAIGWPLAGLFGWILGSFVEVSISQSVPLYSDLYVLTGSVRWLVFAAAQGVVLAVAAAFASGAPRTAGAPDRVAWGAGRMRAALFGLGLFSWVVTSALGGLLYEWWASLDLAVRSNPINQAIGETLTGAGLVLLFGFLRRPVFVACSIVGVLARAGHLAGEILDDSGLFAFVLSTVGSAIVAAGIFCAKNAEGWEG